MGLIPQGDSVLNFRLMSFGKIEIQNHNFKHKHQIYPYRTKSVTKINNGVIFLFPPSHVYVCLPRGEKGGGTGINCSLTIRANITIYPVLFVASLTIRANSRIFGKMETVRAPLEN